jgi:aminopeptidase N
MKNLLLACLFFTTNMLANAQQLDIKHLKLNLSFDWQKKQTFGNAEITFSTTQETDKIALDAVFLSIEKITLGNKNVSFQYDGGDNPKNLVISFDNKHKPNETLTINIVYHSNYENKSDPNAIGGSFGKGLRFFQPTFTTPNKRKQIWSSGEPNGNKYWFPCNSDMADIHTTEIMATVEKPLSVISNGELIQTKDNNNGSSTFHYKSSKPFPSYLVSIVVGEYEAVVQKHKNTTIQTFGYPDEKSAVQATVELLPKMIDFLEEKIGYPFPYKTYNQVVVQDYPFPSLVGQHNGVILSDNYIDDYGVHKDFKYLWDGIAVQALTNQWFGNLLMPKSWKDIWLNNAFAEYFAGIFTAQDNDPAEYLLWYYYPWEKSIVSSDWQGNIKMPIAPNDYMAIPSYNSNNFNKFRGALILRMLQHELGEKLWWQAIQHYVKTNAGKQVSTQDFQNAIEKISGKSYQWFFDQWVYKIGTPILEVTKSYDTQKKQLQLSVKQVQAQENETKYEQVKVFQGKIDVEIDEKNHTIQLKPLQENIFTIPLMDEPKYVHFNVNENFLCDYTYPKNLNEYLSQLQSAKDIAARKIAIDNLVNIAKDSRVSKEIKDKINTAFITQIQTKNYWRYRMYVLSALQRIQGIPYTESFKNLLLNIIKQEQSWLKSTAITILGNTKDEQYLPLYQTALKDSSDRVINSAAIAIGKTKSAKALDILKNIENQKSWKNQNRISTLNGLQQLGDEKALDYVLTCIKDNTSPRWYLATPVWDYPFAAVNTLVSLGKGALAYPVLFERGLV